MIGELEPTEGVVGRHSHLCVARYHQHSTEILDPTKTVLEYFMVGSLILLLLYLLGLGPWGKVRRSFVHAIPTL